MFPPAKFSRIGTRISGGSTGGSSDPGGYPSTITNLVAWYSADYGVTVSSGVVTQWADRSTNAYHMTKASTEGYPSYSTSSFNSLQGVTFDGSDDAVHTSTANTVTGLSSGYAVFIVAKRLSNGSDDVLFSIATDVKAYFNNVTTVGFGNFPGGVAAISERQAGISPTAGSTTTTPVTTGVNYRWGFTSKSTICVIFVNNAFGDWAGGFSSNMEDPCMLNIGGDFVTGPLFGGYSNYTIAEVVVVGANNAFRSTSTTTSMTDLDDYFKTKWGL